MPFKQVPSFFHLVDVSHLLNGIYFYHVKVGEEWQYLKTIKH